MAKHCFNILTFNHPSEEFTFYFTDKEQEGVTRIFHSLVPKEVIEKYGEQEHYYTSFGQQLDGFLPINKSTSDASAPCLDIRSSIALISF